MVRAAPLNVGAVLVIICPLISVVFDSTTKAVEALYAIPEFNSFESRLTPVFFALVQKSTKLCGIFFLTSMLRNLRSCSSVVKPGRFVVATSHVSVFVRRVKAHLRDWSYLSSVA